MKLGNTTIEISPLCLGTMYFGTKTDQRQSERLLDVYLDHGGNFIDTANNYAFWMENGVGDESEKVIGNWIAGGNRHKIVLATKCGARPLAFDGNLENMQMEGLRYQTIVEAVEQSLSRLQTDYVDLLYAHIDFTEFPIEERLRAFEELHQAGKVRAIGNSNTSAWRLEESKHFCEKHQWISYQAVQQKFSYLRPRYNADFWVQKLIDREMQDYCKEKHLTLLAYSTLLSGLYAKDNPDLPEEYLTKDNQLRWQALSDMAQQVQATRNQLVLAWMMNQPHPIVPIVAASREEQLTESMEVLDMQLSEAQWDVLNSAGW